MATLPASNNAEGGTDETTVSTANSGGSSGTAWDNVTIAASTTFVFDNARSVDTGSMGYRITQSTGTGATFARWTLSNTTVYGRAYFNLDAHHSSTHVILDFLSTSQNRARIGINSSGNLLLIDSTGATVATSSLTLPTDAWWRFEWAITFNGSTGSMNVDIFTTHHHATSADENLTVTNQNLGGTSANRMNIGNAASTSASIPDKWFDDVNLNTTAKPGPSGTAPAGGPALRRRRPERGLLLRPRR